MNPLEFIKRELVHCGEYILTDSDNLAISVNIKDYIISKLYSKKFRRWAVDKDTAFRTEYAVKIAVTSGQPVKVVFHQGAYKLWSLPSSPLVDWAEFFNIAHLIKYLSPIVAGYSPGIILYYYLYSFAPEKQDNIKREDIRKYVESFNYLLEQFKKYLPQNFEIKIIEDVDFYSSLDDYSFQLDAMLETGAKDFESKPEDKKKLLLRRSDANINWDGREDWTKIDDVDRIEKIKKGIYYELALYHLHNPRKFTEAEDKILVFIKAGGGWIGIGSTKVSITKPWIGYGVIEKHANKYYGRILSPSQYDKLRDNKLTVVQVNFFEGNRNLNSLIVVENELAFLKDVQLGIK